MRAIVSLTVSAAAAVVLTLAMSAQATAQGQSSTPPAASQEQQVTVVGCVVRESDYRKGRTQGRVVLPGRASASAMNSFLPTRPWREHRDRRSGLLVRLVPSTS